MAHKRSHYRRVCALIRKLKKLGGKQQALDIKQKLCNENKRRPAFLDELSRYESQGHGKHGKHGDVLFASLLPTGHGVCRFLI